MDDQTYKEANANRNRECYQGTMLDFFGKTAQRIIADLRRVLSELSGFDTC
jgi:hypothetical protein